MTDKMPVEEFYDRPMTDPKESAKQFSRYLVYRNLPKHERSVRYTTEKLNEAGDDVAENTLQNTANKFRWHDRALAYDTFLASLEITLIETSLDEAVSYILGQEDAEIAMATRLIQSVMKKAIDGGYNDALSKESEADRAKKIVQTLDSVQKMRRRRAGLPVNYTSKEVEPQDFENQTYVIGVD